jgi:octaprenyl-diphosphate synthase
MKPEMLMSAVQKPVRRELERVQAHLRELFRTPIPILNQVGGHVLATRGKKFRPTLLLLTARLRGHLGQDAVLCATVVEMVHAAALIHDDSVDKSGLRRGVPTVNGLWTDEMAIIMGDYLYAQAMSTLVTHKLDTPMEILARVVTEMSCGEALEFQYASDLDVSEEQYEELIRAKTGSLIGACTEIGAGLNGAARDRRRRGRYRQFGEALGVAFQIVDDLFDYLAEPEVTGKPVGSDLAEGKVTLPLIAALRQAGARDRRRLHRLAARKRWTTPQWDELKTLIERCGGFAYARSRALGHAETARRLLDGEPAGAARQALDRAIDYAVRRDH